MPARHVAIIPARAGSKSIKNKNLISFNGKSLIRIAVDQAVESKIFNKIVVTTDYEKNKLDIGGISSTALTKVILVKRPATLSTDTSMMLDVIKHALENIPGGDKWVWILQPTSPFRRQIDFKNINKILSDYEDITGVISVKPAKEHPNRMLTEKDGKFYKLRNVNFENKELLMPVYERSGNFYVANKQRFFKHKTMEDVFGTDFKGYFMGYPNLANYKEELTMEMSRISRMWGCNIDSPEDLEVAKGYLRRGDVKDF